MPCLGNNRSAHITRHSSDSEFSTTSNFNRKSAPSSSENDAVSQKHAAQSEVPRNVGTIEKKSSWKCMDGRSLDEWMSGFRPTQSTTSLKETPRPKNTNSTNDLSFGKQTCTMYNVSCRVVSDRQTQAEVEKCNVSDATRTRML